MVNRKYKDRLFRSLFGMEEGKDNLLSLFNAINGTDYDDPEELEINTIGDVIYMGTKNDVSFLMDSRLSLYEHQSTLNPNMPLRGLMYFGQLYSKKFLTSERLYSPYLQKIDTPQYYVFYNGDAKAEDRTVLKLSDAFIRPVKEGEFEWTAIMLNINYGKNKKLMDKCKTLKEYSIFVHKIKTRLSEGKGIEEAVDLAVDECIEEDVLRDYLMKHKAEVKEVCLTEYNENETEKFIRQEERDLGRIETIVSLIKENMITIENGAKHLDVSLARMNELMDEFSAEKSL